MADNMRLPLKLLFLVTTLLLILVSCNRAADQIDRQADDWGDVEVRRIQRIRLGVVLSSSGAGSEAESLDIFRAVELAVADAGTINGYQIELAEFNTQCSSAGGRAAALSIVNDPTLIAVIGPGCNEACEAATPILESAHYTFMSASCDGGTFVDRGISGSAYLHTMYDGRVEAELAADFSYNEMGARHVLEINDGTATASNALTAFEARFLELGGTIEESRFENDSASENQFLVGLSNGNVDLIYAPLEADTAARFIAEASNSEFYGIPILGGHHFLSQWLLESTGEDSADLYAVGPTLVGPEYSSMSEGFSRRYGEAPNTIHAAYAYDAARLVIDAIGSIASPQPNGNLLLGRAAMRSALYSTAAFHGLTGTLTCSSSGDCSGANVGVSKVIDGSWTPIFVP